MERQESTTCKLVGKDKTGRGEFQGQSRNRIPAADDF